MQWSTLSDTGRIGKSAMSANSLWKGGRALITLDYELFFGKSTGTVARCLVEPLEYLEKRLTGSNVRACLFVDAAYICRLRSLMGKHRRLARDFDTIMSHLSRLSNAGHDIQLHLHPHWHDSHYDGEKWLLDKDHYRLHTLSPAGQSELVGRCKSLLESVSGRPVFAYRAGGWCLQPFGEISKALRCNDIWLDSTVYKGGFSDEPGRFYDFRHLPPRPWWRFGDDPCKEDVAGSFVELPISSMRLSPGFYWKMATARRAAVSDLTPFGDGAGMRANPRYYLTRLLFGEHSPVSVDGIKSERLGRAFLESDGDSLFNIMGHPKSLSRYAVDRFADFIGDANVEFVTFQDLEFLYPRSKHPAY